MKHMTKAFVAFLLTLAMLVGLVPGMNPAALAEDNPYASLKNTTTVIRFDNKDWYLINYDDSTVMLLLKECFDKSVYIPAGVLSSVSYEDSVAKGIVDQYYNNYFSDAAKGAVSDGKMFLLTRQDAENILDANRNVLKCPKVSGAQGYWWTCTNGQRSGYVVYRVLRTLRQWDHFQRYIRAL